MISTGMFKRPFRSNSSGSRGIPLRMRDSPSTVRRAFTTVDPDLRIRSRDGHYRKNANRQRILARKTGVSTYPID